MSAAAETEPLSTAVRTLLELTSHTTGDEFFRGLARAIAQSLGVKMAFVGALEPTRRTMRSKGVFSDGQPADAFAYELADTPCAEVMTAGVCFYPSGIQALFPRDALLADLGMHAYLGIPLLGAGGTPMGILVALHDQPLEHLPRASLEPILVLFASRAAMELERLETDARLRASEARYRQIVTTCQEGVWVLDTAALTTFANDQMAAMLGYTVEEMLGRHLFDFMDAEARAVAEVHLGRRQQGVAEKHDFRLRHKNGSVVWTIMATNPLRDEQGAFQGSLALCSDVTERRSFELKIQHAQKLESLGVLAGGIAHDFNNLLAGILGNTGMALKELPPESTIRPMLDDVQTASTRAAELTRQLLAYSGKGRFVVEHLHLNRVVEELAHLLRSVISKRAILRFNLAAELPLVDADVAQLRQVVMNLLTNASDALEDKDGLVTISTGVVVADRAYLQSTYLDEQLTEGTYVYVEVADTGCGMDPDTRDKIFDPFFTTKFTGRGLGLAAVLGILRGHRGAVKVHSEPGKGTTFKVLLPAITGSPDARAQAAAGGRAAWRGVGKILVVDDEELVRKAARRVLEQAGFDVMVAVDGQDALERFTAHPDAIIAVLLDMTMPRLNGEETFRRMRTLRPDVRVVLSSGYAEQEAMVHLVGKGLAGFLRKPWLPDDLVAAVHLALDPRAKGR